MDRLNAGNRLPDGGRLLVENPQAADLSVDLTNSLIPRRGVGAVTYTRAGVATVTDNEGVIRTVNSGEARFLGARRVENMTGYSETFSNPAWTKITSTITPNAIAGPTGFSSASSLIEGVGTTQHGISTGTSTTNIQNGVYISSWYAKAGTRQFMQLLISGTVSVQYANFDLINGTFSGSSAGVGAMVSVGNGWYRCSIKYTSTTTNIAIVYCMIASSLADIRYPGYTGDGVSNIYIHAHQHENVTGQSVQTVGEYVSRNILSAPYHGANSDGVKCFNTTLSGATIPASILKGYLAESAKANLFLQSEDFSSVSWSKNNGNVVADFALSPSGYTDADKFVPSAGTSQSYLTQALTVVASIYTISFYFKSAGKQFVQMNAAGFISNGYVNFDIVNGVVGSSSLWSGYIEAVAGFPGMYRCSITTNTVTAGTGNFSLFVVDSNSAARGATSVNNGSDSIIVWGAQFELGDFPSSYIPTTTGAVTRNIDALSYSSSNVVDSQGAAYVEASLILPGNTTSSVPSRFLLSRGTNGRIFYLVATITNINNYDGTTALASNVGTTMNGNIVKMASSWSGSTKDIYYGTTTPKTSAFDGTMGTGNIDVGVTWNGTIRNLKIWKTPPTVAELTSITTL